MATVWCRAGVRTWAKLLDGVEIEPDVWLVETGGEWFVLSYRAGQVYLAGVELKSADV